MNVIWCDTETTGLEPNNSGAFEIAFIFVVEGEIKVKKIFYLNPLNENILYHEEAAKIHKVSKEEILSYAPCEKVVPSIVSFLDEALNYSGETKKMIFAGYNCNFDYRHLSALFSRCGFNLNKYFERQFDVMDFVKKAVRQKKVKKFENLKLGTVCKSLNIPLDNAHSALCDIEATRNVSIELFRKGTKLN